MNSRNLVGMLEGKKKLSKLKNTISYQYCVEQAKKAFNAHVGQTNTTSRKNVNMF